MSALEDRLHKFAHEWHEAMSSPHAVNLMPLLVEAASDVRSLAASSLEAENAKLKEELEAVGTAAYLYGRSDLKSENAKLRELASIMLKCIMAKERRFIVCWECPVHKQFDELRSYCCLEHEAKELGIEVTDE